MENRIEQEINKTLQCMDNAPDIRVSPLFAENLSKRIANTQISRGIGYPNRVFYPAAIILMVVLNLGALFMSFTGHVQASTSPADQTSTIASEYGMGQSNNMTF